MCAPGRLSRAWDGQRSVQSLTVSDFTACKVSFSTFDMSVLQTSYSLHILLLQQKSGHVVVFFAGSGHVLPETW